jgi:hypothetical protein
MLLTIIILLFNTLEEFPFYNMTRVKIKLKTNLPEGKTGDILEVKKDNKYLSYWLARIKDGDVEFFVDNSKNRIITKE